MCVRVCVALWCLCVCVCVCVFVCVCERERKRLRGRRNFIFIREYVCEGREREGEEILYTLNTVRIYV